MGGATELCSRLRKQDDKRTCDLGFVKWVFCCNKRIISGSNCGTNFYVFLRKALFRPNVVSAADCECA